MPHQEQVIETYWCPGPWPWEWFDTCKRTVTKWCYDFSWVEETGYFFFSYDKGCEDGVEYGWYAFSLFIVGSTYYGAGKMCFDSQLSRIGQCAGVSIEAVKAPATVPHVQSLARKRIRLRQHHELIAADESGRDGC
jgi:hypothetical protein